LRRLTEVKPLLDGTAFSVARGPDHVLVTCPWGNRIRCHPPGPGFGDTTLGIAYVEFPVAPGQSAGIARFYQVVMGALATLEAGTARIRVGPAQQLVFRETEGPLAPYDGHHIAIYVANFSGPHRWLREHGLVTEESSRYQYRFERIVDPATGTECFVVEHEVRSLTHPMYQRPLINRDPAQRQRTYRRGRDAFVP
jgi:hypothetical protein